MGRAYTTVQAYVGAFPGTTETPNERLIERASRAVDIFLVSATYITDAEGLAIDPEVKQAIEDATLEQCYALMLEQARHAAATDNPLGRPLESASVGQATWKASSVDAAHPHTLPAGGGLCVSAQTFLTSVPRQITVHG
ncbi:MAG: hypothetical protein IPM11_01460 [Micropruina sp.]|nr:hypothetical protein [Micropruina sp.]